VAGEYSAQVDDDSLPSGYSSETLVTLPSIAVGATSPGRAAFTARALRSISGRVLRYDRAAGSYVPMAGARVILRERATTSVTDAAGRYLFRNLAAGAYTVAVEDQTQAPARPVRLGAQPVDLKEVNFQISELVVPEAPSPAAAALVKSAAPAANAPLRQSATAQQRNILGRQFAKAGRYADAVAEFTEAIRLAPELALAWNARGFARLMLHDCAGAKDDLDRAILLNPGYADAYKIRAAARRATGDRAGAAADLKKSQNLAD
jgi:tetratricopeptide (TPR) repeat protein